MNLYSGGSNGIAVWFWDWTFTKMSQKRLTTFRNEILRRIFGPVPEENTWRVKKNRELKDLYKGLRVVGLIRSRRIRRLGHVQSRNGNTLIKRAYGKEDLMEWGEPRMRWNYQVRCHLRKLEAGLEMDELRKTWRRLIGEAKNQLIVWWSQEWVEECTLYFIFYRNSYAVGNKEFF